MIPDGLVEALRRAERVAVLSGAGISAESGIPTFRDAQTGLWAQFDPQELATPQAFRRNPRLVWEWYAFRRKLIADKTPNRGHVALAVMEAHVPAFILITQNIDGLHQRAGSRRVIELHGNIRRVKCFDECRPTSEWLPTEADADAHGGEVPPRCPYCGAWLRPDVVWFGELLPTEALEAARLAAENCQLFFSVGTSGLVQPAASLPFWALEHGAVVVEVNPEETPLTAWATYALRGPAGVILPALVQRAWPSDAPLIVTAA